MKAKEFEIKKRDPNWKAMQDIRRSGAGGQHKDKKKAAKQGDVKHKGKMEEQDDWGSMSHREFKRKELQHELGHEDDPEFQRLMREKDRGPWYIKIDGKIYRQNGEPKAFDWKKGANNYALAIVKNRPELKAKTVLTRKPVDENIEEAKKKMSAKDDPCWKGYKMVGTKKKDGKEVPNCVPGKKGD